ncbi:MAG TPA: metallophosphoesterase [Solimonas sp.]|nr:metallophosphoesterase [Solimonas sp.]
MSDRDDMPAFEEIHVISDLHMGGKPGFQILKETKRLANFIRHVEGLRPAERVALVLNGDVIDSLAEDSKHYIAVDDAADVVRRIMRDDAFSCIWDALASFVHKDKRTLVIVIGNHDIELALPPVQNLVLKQLAGDDPAARGRVQFSVAGGGFACKVGDKRVFCIHGNEVDAWNYNRYEDLARVSRRLNAGMPFEPERWVANAGTRMVKDVMNGVKRRYAWIDLLKPENSAAIGTLMVLDPSQAKKLSSLFGVVGERIKGKGEVDQRLFDDRFVTAGPDAVSSLSMDRLLGPNLRANFSESPDDMLRAAEARRRSGQAGVGQSDSTLGTGQLIWDRLTGWIRGVEKHEALRRALKDWLAEDRSFDSSDQDQTYKDVTAAVADDVDYIVTGHTHLARSIEVGAGRHYLNCGTWIRLIRFTDEMLRDEASFAAVFKVLEKGGMSDIDNASFGGQKLVLDRTTAASIGVKGKAVVGQLLSIVGDGSGEPQPFRD